MPRLSHHQRPMVHAAHKRAPRRHDTVMDATPRAPRWVWVLLAACIFSAVAVDRSLAKPGQSPPAIAASSEQAAVPTTSRIAAVATPPTTNTAALRQKSSSPTRDVALERTLKRTLEQAKTPFAATVLVEIGTGRVLAVAEHSTRGEATGLAGKAFTKAASVFKLVTASALLRADVDADTRVCSHGGKTRMQAGLLVDNPRRDTACHSLSDAVAHSQNVAMAKLALAHLDPARLRAEAQNFGFVVSDATGTNASSHAQVPDDPFAFANTAAGFGDVYLSALDAARLAATIAQDGVEVPLRFDEAAPFADVQRRIDKKHARALRAMMAATVKDGTGHRAFSQQPRLNTSAAGKTGSLADYKTQLETTWFIGYAPADEPVVAVASVVVNTPVWHQRAPAVAKEALRAYLATPTRGTVVAAK